MSDQPYVNLLDPEFYVDPWDAYRWLRDNDPVFWDPVQKLWGISRFEDVLHVEKHAQLYTSFRGSRPHIDQTDNTSMIDQDDPAHQCQRSLIVRRFTPRAVSTQEDEVREVAAAIVDAVAPRGSCDAVEAIASRLPAIMIGRRLGYAPEQWEQVRHWSEVTMHQGGQTPGRPGVEGVLGRHRADDHPGVEDRHPGPLGERRERGAGDDAAQSAPGDHGGPPGTAQQLYGLGHRLGRRGGGIGQAHVRLRRCVQPHTAEEHVDGQVEHHRPGDAGERGAHRQPDEPGDLGRGRHPVRPLGERGGDRGLVEEALQRVRLHLALRG